jgi:hypothetical protein
MPTYEERTEREQESKYYGQWHKEESKKLLEFICKSIDGETKEIREKNEAAAIRAGQKIHEAEKIRNWREHQRSEGIKSDREIQADEEAKVLNRKYWVKKVKELEEAKQEQLEKRRDRLLLEMERKDRENRMERIGKKKDNVEPPPNPAPDPDQEMEEEEGDEGNKDQYQYNSAEDPYH